MNALELVKLPKLMETTSGRAEIVIGLIDGPVAVEHGDLAGTEIRVVPGNLSGACTLTNSVACSHGTFVAGLLAADARSMTPGICPHCSLLVRPIFTEQVTRAGELPHAVPEELAAAVVDCVRGGAHVLNLSVALAQPSTNGVHTVAEALHYAAQSGVMVVAAAGNQGTMGSTVITGNSWVVPVVAYDRQGRPMEQSNLGSSIGRSGLGASGDSITRLGAEGKPLTLSGTSVATPFVTGAVALLRSACPAAPAAAVKYAITHAAASRRNTVVPPLLDAWGAYQMLRRSGF